MKKSTKGALAGGAMVVLLMGGAGSLAYWNDTQSLPASTVTSGHLKLVSDPAAPAAWKLNGNAVADITAVRIVPGDQLTFTGGYKLQAKGDNIKGTLAVTGAAGSGPLAAPGTSGGVTTTATFTKGGTAITGTPTVTQADDNAAIGASVLIDFPFGTTADNASNVLGGLTLNLTAIQVSVTQVDATP